jgi:hypothetical protein
MQTQGQNIVPCWGEGNSNFLGVVHWGSDGKMRRTMNAVEVVERAPVMVFELERERQKEREREMMMMMMMMIRMMMIRMMI